MSECQNCSKGSFPFQAFSRYINQKVQVSPSCYYHIWIITLNSNAKKRNNSFIPTTNDVCSHFVYFTSCSYSLWLYVLIMIIQCWLISKPGANQQQKQDRFSLVYMSDYAAESEAFFKEYFWIQAYSLVENITFKIISIFRTFKTCKFVFANVPLMCAWYFDHCRAAVFLHASPARTLGLAAIWCLVQGHISTWEVCKLQKLSTVSILVTRRRQAW